MAFLPYDQDVVIQLRGVREFPLAPAASETDRMAAKIERAIDEATAGGIQDLQVLILPDGVVLTGRCPTYHIKQKAQHAALKFVSGNLENEIEVAWRR